MPVITLVNLGGPRNSQEIEPFLRDLFLDPYLFDLPLWEPLRQILGKFIANKRAPRVATAYSSMGFGGGSPLVSETQKQAEKLAEYLNRTTNKQWKPRIAMTCGFPNIRDLPKEELIPSVENVIIPLFPHFSRSTTMSLGNIIQSITGICPLGMTGWIDTFAEDKRFSDISANLIYEAFTGKLERSNFIHWEGGDPVPDWENMDIVFSAHGIPMRLVKKGDVYPREIKSSVENIEKELRKKGFKGEIHISFQSRVGPAKWTEPNTKETLAKLGKLNKRIAVYPISFLSDHLETLEEIGEELKNIALESGAKEFFRIPSFGTYQPFLEYLSVLVTESISKSTKKDCICLLNGGEKLLKSCCST